MNKHIDFVNHLNQIICDGEHKFGFEISWGEEFELLCFKNNDIVSSISSEIFDNGYDFLADIICTGTEPEYRGKGYNVVLWILFMVVFRLIGIRFIMAHPVSPVIVHILKQLKFTSQIDGSEILPNLYPWSFKENFQDHPNDYLLPLTEKYYNTGIISEEDYLTTKKIVSQLLADNIYNDKADWKLDEKIMQVYSKLLGKYTDKLKNMKDGYLFYIDKFKNLDPNVLSTTLYPHHDEIKNFLESKDIDVKAFYMTSEFYKDIDTVNWNDMYAMLSKRLKKIMCIDTEELMNLFNKYLGINIGMEINGGAYYHKYIKYKTKYVSLKNKADHL